LKIAFDFDGVCTDLSYIREHNINESRYLFSPFSISLSKVRPGVLELVSIFGLFAELYILTARPTDDVIFINEWLKENQLNQFFKKVLSCNETAKSDVMKRHKINLLIDDTPIHFLSLSNYMGGILWLNQTWIEISNQIFKYLVNTSCASLRSLPEKRLREIKYATNLGSSQVYILTFNDNSKLKLRVCLNRETVDRVMMFLKITKKNKIKSVSRLVASNGLAIVKNYIDGKVISSYTREERLSIITRVGSTLARLHEIKLDMSISDKKFAINSENESLLVFSADNYNTIVTDNGEVAFIDLEMCSSGSRWIDFYWCDFFLCENDQEKVAFYDGYFLIYRGDHATEEEKKIAILNFKLWVSFQLQYSRKIHFNDKEKIRTIEDTLKELWNY